MARYIHFVGFRTKQQFTNAVRVLDSRISSIVFTIIECMVIQVFQLIQKLIAWFLVTRGTIRRANTLTMTATEFGIGIETFKYISQPQRSPPSAGFSIFQGTLANPNNCSEIGVYRAYAPPLIFGQSDSSLTQCFPPTITSENLFSPYKTHRPPKKFFTKNSIDPSRIFPYRTI